MFACLVWQFKWAGCNVCLVVDLNISLTNINIIIIDVTVGWFLHGKVLKWLKEKLQKECLEKNKVSKNFT